MTAVIALLIGIWAADDGIVRLSPDDSLVPVFDGASRDRRTGASLSVDDETVGAMAPDTGVVTIERRIIIRIPTLPRPAVPEARSFSPKAAVANPIARQKATCLTLRSLKGAALDERAGIIFVTATDNRYQAVLERGCRPVDFQSGFYLSPSADGAICAGRDMLHARSGLRCTIAGLTRLSAGM
ncbi:hypothetical protein LWE61_12220 [Sphingobium sufflavum]|uniref:hypothetical protein n=1 Tax=Sphingobium sufflavum TaxID=1129547 RepID=UPI001F1F1715|nr:hypothetical protein [Sphingobium sufflavum]MCE7797321.1 hypothetical protein [Sphingobium sufflavum]